MQKLFGHTVSHTDIHSELFSLPGSPKLPVITHCHFGKYVASVVRRMNEVALRRARLVLGDRLRRAGMPSRYVTSQLGQLSLPFFWSR